MGKKFTFKNRKKPSSPLWKMEDGITYSALSKWLQCREQFSLQWIDGVTPKRLSNGLEFGSIMHHAIEHQFKGDPQYVIDTICSQYYEHRSKNCKNSTERDTLKYLLELARITFPRYCKYWHEDDSIITWLGREEKFALPYVIKDIDGNDREILLRGMRDGIYTNADSTIYGVFETKTMSRIIEKDIVDNLQYDMQTLLYCFCTYLSTGVYPNEINYNVIRRPDLYRRKDEKDIDFLKRLADDIDSRPDFYFKRYEATVSSADIEMFRTKTLEPILKLFVQWWDSIKKNPLGEDQEYWYRDDDYGTIKGRWSSQYHFLNSSALVGKYGKAEMWDAIFGDMQPYKIRKEIFPELEESFQVTWPEESGTNEEVEATETFDLWDE